MPEFILEAAEESVRDQLEQQRAALNSLLATDPDLADPRQRRRLASAYGELGQLYVLYDLSLPAEAALGNATRLDPDEPRWRYLLATQLQLDNRVDAAIAGFRAVLEAQPTNGAAWIRLGNLLLAQERLEAASEAFERAKELEGAGAAAHYGLGRVERAMGNLEAAAEHLATALQLQPEASLVHFHLGETFRDLGDTERARFHFANRGERKVFFYDPVALELQQLAGGVGALLSLGRISLSMGELETAEQRFRAALRIEPESPAALKAVASALQLRGDLAGALEYYEQAAEQQPDDAALRHFIAQFIDDLVVVAEDEQTAARQRRRWDARAIEHLEAALRIAPEFVPAWMLLSDIELRRGDTEAAAEAIDKAIGIAPADADLRFLRARVLSRTDRVDEALAALERYDSIVEQQEVPPDLEARLEHAKLLLDLGQHSRGSEALRSIASDPDPAVIDTQRAAALFELGNHLAGQGQLQSAVEVYRRAAALAPSNALIQFNLGTVLGRQGDFQGASQAHRQASNLDPDSQQARLGEAMALVLAGEHQRARERLEQGLERLPAAASLAHLLTTILLAAPDESVRDVEVGLDLAHRLFEAIPSVQHAETVALGLAAAGRFDRAVEWQQRILDELATTEGAPEQALESARRRLETYRRGDTIVAPWSQ